MRHEQGRRPTGPAGGSWRRMAGSVLVGLALFSAACGGSSGPSEAEVATLGGRTGGDDARDEGRGAGKDPEAAALAFARCMRKNGVDLPDPGADGMIVVGDAPKAGEPVEANREEMQKAEQACKKEREALQGTIGEPPADIQDKFLKMSRCMRRHGIDMPDPSTGGDGEVTVGVERSDFDDPEFRAAQETCRKEVGLPEPGAGGGAAVEVSP